MNCIQIENCLFLEAKTPVLCNMCTSENLKHSFNFLQSMSFKISRQFFFLSITNAFYFCI